MKKQEATERKIGLDKNFDEYLIESLKDPEEAAIYLQVALDEYQEEGDTEFFMTALRNVAQANGGARKKTELPRQNLYRTLSSKGHFSPGLPH